MAYATQNFKLMLGGLSGVAQCQIWLLDTVEAIADVNTSNYVSDGYRKGARAGDMVIVRTWTTVGTGAPSAVNFCWVTDVATGSDALGIDLSNGDAQTLTDSD